MTKDYMIDGVGMRHLGLHKDISDLIQDRLLKDWPCWLYLERLYVELESGPWYFHHNNFRKTLGELRPGIE
ncbi:hypothetical protein BGZ54_005238, partial [Gamsiella multidivaricata]